MDKFLLFINSAYFGLGVFFSFYVAPTLFKLLAKEQAGSVVERVFPIYFGIGLAASLLTLVLGLRLGKAIAFLALINSVMHALHLLYILPTAHALKAVDYQAFMKWHGVSMATNLTSLLITLIICVVLIRR
jgi:uncharacterized membrane protein YwzB